MHTEFFPPAKLGRIWAKPQPWRVRGFAGRFGVLLAGMGLCILTGIPGGQAGAPQMPVCRAILEISGIWGEIFEKAANWIEQILPRELGDGKNAGG
jgi:hypothetical protein